MMVNKIYIIVKKDEFMYNSNMLKIKKKKINKIDSYFMLLKNLDDTQKLTLISELSNSMLVDQEEKEKKFYSLCGKLDTKKSAEELINDIRSSRYFESSRDVVL